MNLIPLRREPVRTLANVDSEMVIMYINDKKRFKQQ